MRVKRNYVEGKGRIRLLRLTSVLLDSAFVDIPVYAWAIEHPEGTIVIDTGETAQVNDPEYFPAIQRPYWKSQYRFKISPQDEIGPQLRARGIEPEAVRWLVLTHTHFDHTDALYHFPNAEVVVSRKEYDDAQTYRSAHFAFPSKWPRWLKPRLIDYVPGRVGPFSQSYVLTKAGDVRIVPTPGHTMGHQSVILQDEGLHYFFGGDTSFDLPSLLNGTLDAPAFNSDAVLETRRRILDYARDVPLVYLTTHDFETENRLIRRIPLQGQIRQPVREVTH
jgi:glyoxylase-like metal-dependent hydrolase (beta-lactamase superfamily II)